MSLFFCLWNLKQQANFYYMLFSESGFNERLIAEAASKAKEIQIYMLKKISHSCIFV